ncbi:MAG: hypothetical protein IKJ43_03615 [Bacilli bacterium]|nr:hypothetical protein [Bacilli bacterium]
MAKPRKVEKKDTSKDEIFKNVMIGVLVAIIVVMGLGYAAFTQQLTINGTAEITSKWDVHIKSIVPDKNATSVTEEGNVRYTSAGSISSSVLNANTAEFSAVLVAPGDTVNYTVTVENSGTLDAKIDTNGIVFSDLTQMNKLANNTADDAIVFSYSGIGDGTVINKNGGTNVFTISVTYNSRFTSQPEGGQLRKNLEMILNYIQA